MFCERSLAAGSSAAVSHSNVGQSRLKVTAQHVHAGRVAHGKRPRPAGTAAPRTSALTLSGTVYPLQADEEVDAIAVLEQPGSVSSTQFQQHDQAQDMLAQLEAINAELRAGIQSTEVLIEQSQWDTYTLPDEVRDHFTHTYRKTRKEQERSDKEERAKRAKARAERAAARAAADGAAQQQHSAATAAAEQPVAPAALEQAMPAQLQQPLLHQHHPQQQHVADSFPAAPSSQPAAPAQRAQALKQPLAPQPQPTQRARRGRRGASSSGLAAPAAISSSVLNSIATSIASSSSTQAVAPLAVSEDRPAAAAAAAAVSPVASPATPAAAAAPVAPVAGATAPKSRTARATPKLSAMAPHSSSSSSSSSALAVASPVRQQQQAASGFAPLSVLSQQQQGLAASAKPATSRRLLRGAGVCRTASTAAAAAAPTMAGGKLADNTLHGLDLRAELLTGEQEKDLAVMVQDLLGLEATCKDLALQLGRTPTDMEWMAAAGADSGFPDLQAALTTFQGRLHAGRNAKQVMIKANYKLVVSICRKYQGLGMNMGDLINEGIAGLVKGVEKFEPAKGFKFSTYAHWWIRQSVSRSLSDQGRLVRLPTHMQELLHKAGKASKVFEAQHGREPTAEELAPQLGVEASRIKDAWDAVLTPRSLDQPYGDAEGGTLGDIVEDDRIIGSEEAVYVESLKKDLEGVLAGLCDRDAGVLRMRFGLLDGREYTLDEVGAEFKVTRERIRQIEAKAIRQLRAHHVNPGSVMADYTHGSMADKQLASRTSSGLKKQK